MYVCVCVCVCYTLQMRTLESVSDIALGLTHPRRTKLQHGTFLRFGHPRLVLSLLIVSQ